MEFKRYKDALGGSTPLKVSAVLLYICLVYFVFFSPSLLQEEGFHLNKTQVLMSLPVI